MTLKIKQTTAALTMLAVLACTQSAWAHSPIAQCKQLPQQLIECEGAFSDGSKAAGVTMDVMSYDEKILISGKLDNDSKLRFKRPSGDFYVLFDAGPGHVLEIDQAEIKEAF